MTEDARRAIREAPIPWDDLRQQRVLSRIEATRQQRRSAPPSRASRARRTVPTAIAAIAAGLVLGVGLWGLSRVPTPPSLIAARGLDGMSSWARRDASAATSTASMALADGSVAHLHETARVDVDVQTSDLVRLLQHSGVVRYEVAPNPARRFVVDAQGVEVRVIGTIFTVEVGEQRVTVEVERGKVAVETSDRVAELVAGDNLSVEIEPEETLVIVEDEPPPADDEQDRRPRRPEPSPPSVTELLARADAARASGRLAEAASTLSELVRRYPRDPRTYSSYFQLGKVERARGHHGAAASAFAACYKRASSGALSEDARAEAAVSWRDAGQQTRAVKAARDYLERYPTGPHADRMRRILDRVR